MKKLILLILLAATCCFFTFYKTNDNHSYKLEIKFMDDSDVIYLDSRDEIYNCWKLVRSMNGIVSIEPETIDLNGEGEYEVIYKIKNQEDVREYVKKFIVKESRPIINIKQKEVYVNLNQELNLEDFYSINNQLDWLLEIDSNVDNSKEGKYLVSIKLSKNSEEISDNFEVWVVDNYSLACSYKWVIDDPEVKEVGHYQQVFVEEKGHYENVLISEEEGHYQTIVHPAITHTEPIYEDYRLYTFYHQDSSKDIVIPEYQLYERTGFSSASSYFTYLSKKDSGYIGYYFDWQSRIVGYQEVIDEPSWQEEIWVVDKQAVYQQVWVVDQKAYYENKWVVDIPYQKEKGHFEKNCN